MRILFLTAFFSLYPWNVSAGDCSDPAAFCSDGTDLKSCLTCLETKKDLPSGLAAICEKAAEDGKAQGFLCLCRIERLSGRLPRALANCRKAIEKDPVSADAHTEKGLVYSAMKKSGKALEAFRTSVMISSENPKALFSEAAEYEKIGDYPKALASYSDFLDLKNETPSLSMLKKRDSAKRRISSLKKILALKEANKKKKLYAACLKEYRKIKPAGDAEKTYEKLSYCLSLGPGDSKLFKDRAELESSLGLYEKAAGEYGKLIKKEPHNAGLFVARGRALFRSGKSELAEKDFKEAFRLKAKDERAMTLYGDLLKSHGDYAGAFEVYSFILAFAPGETVREETEILRDKSMTDDEIVKNLKLRGIMKENEKFLYPENKKLFEDIRKAERKGAIEYLKKKYMGYANLMVDVLEGKEFSTKLTAQGYKLYLKDTTQAAVRFFEKKGIRIDEIFKLRNLIGNPVFTPKGEITGEGLEAYSKTLETGEKTWLGIYEEAPKSPDAEAIREAGEINEKIKTLLTAGFEEISGPEYDWLMLVTDCPDEILRNKPCDIRTVQTSSGIRYFICSKELRCPDEALKLFSYIIRYRDGDSSVPKSGRSTAFFGSGGSEGRRFCYKGKIWNGLD